MTRIGCSPLSGRIYAGKLNKKGDVWLTKTDVTNECCGAVIEHVLHNKGSQIVSVNGQPAYEIKVINLKKDKANEHS